MQNFFELSIADNLNHATLLLKGYLNSVMVNAKRVVL